LNRRKGSEVQHRKAENVSAGESSATESGDEDVSPSTISYTATQHTPTSIKLTVNRIKRSKSKKRKKSAEKARGTPKSKKVKAFREGSRKSMRMKNSTTEANTLDENTAEGWESRIRQWTDQYEEALANQYSADIQTLLQLYRAASTTISASVEGMNTINCTELSCNNTVLGSQMQLQLGRVTRVQKHRKILRAAKNLEPGTLIIEYRGKVMLKQQFEVNGHFFKKPYPFVLFYSKFNDVEMCVDARTFGNDARFIRRSCTPNAEVRHMISDGMIHLCIYAVSQITKDAEVTIGFDYEFNSCNYKVDCACHKGNQNCPVQKHNMSPRENLLTTPSLPISTPLPGAETRRRKARRRALEVGLGTEATQEVTGLQGSSDTEERLLDEVKTEDGEDGEMDDHGIAISIKRVRNFAYFTVFISYIDRRRRRAGASEVKEDNVVENEDGSGTPPVPHTSGVGVSTRRTTSVMVIKVIFSLSFVYKDALCAEEKPTLPSPPAPAAPPKPPRPNKPRPKSRVSRYRSSSSQRARRQRQALAQQAAAATAAAVAATPSSAEQSGGPEEEGPEGRYSAEHVHREGSLGSQVLDGDSQSLNCISRANLRYPKTKKYLVTEWLNDKIPGGDKVHQEVPIERPLRISTDPTVLATTLNMLPGLSHSSLICTMPRHYVRFGSPFNPERRRPRPLQMDGTYGCCKKRWIKQLEDESCSASVEDGTESTSSQQSTSSRSTPNPLSGELNVPFKKRHGRYITGATPALSDHLLRPLSPITPPLPEEDLHSLLHGPHGSLLTNGVAFSPLPLLPVGCCNTMLQFELFSCLQMDLDGPRPQFSDMSLPSSLGSPVAVTSEDFSIPGALQDSSQGSSKPASCPLSDPNPSNREQAFKTEFNLIYTCSPLNANLGNPISTDRRLSCSEGAFSPAESFHSAISGLLGDVGTGSMSPYNEAYLDSGTPPHISNPPQKKKVSLLEYRKRKQGSTREPESVGTSSSFSSTSTRPSSQYTQEFHHPQQHQRVQTLASSAGSYSSSTLIPQVEEVSPPDYQGAVLSRRQDSNNQWMVPTTVERLREGQGVRERLLRGIKVERSYKTADGSTEIESVVTRKSSIFSNKESPQIQSFCVPTGTTHYSSPYLSEFAQCVCPCVKSSESLQQTSSPSFLQQTSSSPFTTSYSPSSTHSFYHRLASSQQNHSPSSHPANPPTLSSDSKPTAGSVHQHSNSVEEGGYSSHLKASLLNSLPPAASPTPRVHSHTKLDSGGVAPRGGQQSASRGLKSDNPQQTALHASSRLLAASTSSHSATHYPQHQFQHSPLQGTGVRTQSGSL
uniref:SET domain containing 5 n=1 Tax=Tetraodon nigroviridis TaxID=99883 RepID=H3CBV6_TETNG